MPMLWANHVPHHYRLEGDRSLPALVLIHPVGADHGIWDKLVPLLTSQFCVLRYDLRGHGGSHVGSEEYQLPQLAQDLLALTEALGMHRFVVCGISLGGLTAMQAALLAPERVQAAVVCSAAARMAAPPGGWDGRAQQALEQGLTTLANGMVQRMFSAEFRASHDASIATCHNTLALMEPQGYANACAVLRDADLVADLPRIQCPVLVVSGQSDPLFSAETAQAMAQAMPRGQHLPMAAGHFPPLEQSAAFAKALRDWSTSPAVAV